MRVREAQFDPETAMRLHRRLLGHDGHGITELRTFGEKPLVAYTNSEDAVVRLALEMDGRVSGIYIGVQPRPLKLFDKSPNCWRPARSGEDSNCARDRDVEFLTTMFFDIDVVSPERSNGRPASDAELEASLGAARLLCRQDGLALNSAICLSGNGHYVLAPLVPIPIESDEVAKQFRSFCSGLAERVAWRIAGARLDPVFNPSRVMRLMGTANQKGRAVEGRPHRRACFLSGVLPARSIALHHMILNTTVRHRAGAGPSLSRGIKCNLRKIEACAFIQWCRREPREVSEPLWFAMITNLAHLKGGPEIAHEISGLDTERYDREQTQRLIDRILERGYLAVGCETISELGFKCPRLNTCCAGSPMYLTALRCVYG